MHSHETTAGEYGERTTQFKQWLQTRGVTTSSKIQLADLRSQGAGRAVVATQDIPADETLFSIPRSSILTVETSTLPSTIKDQLTDPWLALILVLLHEYALEGDSIWTPYLNVLPADFDTLVYWTDAQLAHLEGSAVVHKIGKHHADRTFTDQILPLVKQHAGFASLHQDDDRTLLALCHHAASTIMAYAFDLERTSASTSTSQQDDGWEDDSSSGEVQPKGMIPLADMLNADADLNNARLFFHEDDDAAVVMKTVKAVSAGEELFNDYGPLPRADVLRRYGYVTENYARYDVVEISLDMIKQAAGQQQQQLKLGSGEAEAELETRTAYLDEHGVLDDGYDISRASSEEGPFPEALCALLNALTMSGEDFEKLREKEKLPKTELSKAAAELLYAVLVRRRSLYAEPGRQSSASATDPESQRRLAMARQVIDGEKQVLREAAEAVLVMLSSNGGKKRKADTFEAEGEALRSSVTKESRTT